MRKPLTANEAAMLVTFFAPTADHQSASPTANPPVLLPERNAEEEPDKDPPAPGGGVVDVTKLAVGVQKTRDPDLMNLLAEHSMPQILATARRNLRDKSLVEDCAQNVAVKLFVEGGLAAFDPARGKFETFLFWQACDFAGRANRKCDRESKLERDFEADMFADTRDETPIDVLVQREAAADAIERTKRRLDQIEACLDGNYLVGFQARRNGLTYLELAANTGENKHTARSWIFRGMRKAREVA